MKKFFYSLILLTGVVLILAGAVSLGTGSVGTVVVLVVAGTALVILSIKKLRKNRSGKSVEDKKPTDAVEKALATQLAEEIKQQSPQAVKTLETIEEQEKRRETLAYAISLVVDDFLEDNVLSRDEEKILDDFVSKTGFSGNDLNDYGGVSRILKASALRQILNGEKPENLPDFHMPIHFNFQKSEDLIWAFSNVDYYKEVSRRSYQGGHQGFSVRVAKGLYYRTGAFKGHPVEETSMEYQDTGIMALTTKHIYFGSYDKIFRVRYNKIVAFTPYEDGLGIMKDTQRAKPMVFKLEDGWFAYNLAINLAQQL
ncbi:MAG: hypothetical protein ACQESX_05470 [Bacteroidota bacterium]